MPLSEEQKAKMAEGRRRAAEKRALAKSLARAERAKDRQETRTLTKVPTVPEVTPKGILPMQAEIAVMGRVYDMLEAAGAVPLESPLGRPLSRPQAMALMLKGWELGIPPIQAMEGLYIAKDGMLAQRADLMRALIQRSGYGLIIPITLENEKVIVKGIRYGTGGRADQETLVTYTLTDLQRQGGLSDEARRHPKGTLFARATGEMARAMFSDILRGACYTPEELTPLTTTQSPSEPAPAPTPTQTPPPAHEAPPTSAPVAVRGITQEFLVPDGKGGMAQAKTAGLTEPIWRALMSLARLTPDLTAFAKAEVRRLTEQDSVLMLTNEEGQQIVRALQAKVKGNGHAEPAEEEPTGGSAAQALDQFVSEYNAGLQMKGLDPVDPSLVHKLVAASYDVESVDRLTMLQAQQAVKEIRHVSRDPQAFALMLARAS